MNTNAMIPQAFNAADYASGKSDRWLMIFLMFTIMAVGVAIVRWALMQNQRQNEEHKESREAHLTAITKIVADQNATNKDLTVVLTRNTQALDDCATEMRFCREGRDRERR